MRYVRGTLVWAFAAAIAACATKGVSTEGSAPAVTSTVQPRELEVSGMTYNLSSVEDRDVMVKTILAPVDSVWRVLPGVFLELGVQPGTIDPVKYVISNTSFKARRTLGGTRLSRYFDCGTSVVGPNADQMAITISLTVQVVRDSSAISTMRTQVNAFGISEGVSGVAVHCGSTGGLEARVARMVTDELARRAPR